MFVMFVISGEEREKRSQNLELTRDKKSNVIPRSYSALIHQEEGKVQGGRVWGRREAQMILNGGNSLEKKNEKNENTYKKVSCGPF